jgi:hypothetical protein
METQGNPTGRRPNPGPRIQLTSRQPTRRKTAAKKNLGKAARKTTLMSNELASKASPIREIPASEELHHFRISAVSVSALPKWPPFPPRPPFPALGSSHERPQRPSPKSNSLAVCILPSSSQSGPPWAGWLSGHPTNHLFFGKPKDNNANDNQKNALSKDAQGDPTPSPASEYLPGSSE